MKGKLLTALAVVALLASVAIPAAALTGTMVDQEVQVSDDTQSIQVVAENITNDTADVAINETLDGETTEVFTATLNTSTDSMDSVEFSDLNASAEYRVLVDGDGADSINVEKIEAIEATGPAGTGIADLDGTQQAALTVLAAFFFLAALYWVLRDSLDLDFLR
ncbi:hypothetical protein [Halapricum desulfuricans]|uniref:Uncharacterized protein n=1 Tax=Halapricum desulfuricans TaxID=2841257 RepID=A0A897N493_9EURY|nr:hypothetical protein [Halapricum desulfuricans]QSG06083.1 hypothetical protein HSR121_1748 [Halapricum desulfuricans]